MNHQRQAGFSLVEILSVVSIMAILLSNAMPLMHGYFDKKHLIAAAEMVYGQLQLARSEAIARSEDIYVKFAIDGSDDWSIGTSALSDCNPLDGLADANPCYLLIDDGDGVTTAADRVLRRICSDAYPEIKITNVTFGSDRAKFDYVRGTGKAGSVKLESASGYRIKVVTSRMGRVRLCSPSGIAHVANYSSGNCTW